MKIEDAIRKVMVESIRNAEQWLKDSETLMSSGSPAHCSVLRDFAGEEIAKAYVCWQVLAGMVPLNHPIVEHNNEVSIESIREKIERESRETKERHEQGTKSRKVISVFKSHAVKNVLLVDMSVLLARLIQGRGQGPLKAQAEEAANNILEGLTSMMGELGAAKRFEWMYVNLIRTKEGYIVTSPMQTDLVVSPFSFALQRGFLEFVRNLSSEPIEKFVDLAREMRRARRGRDLFFPKEPRWAVSIDDD